MYCFQNYLIHKYGSHYCTKCLCCAVFMLKYLSWKLVNIVFRSSIFEKLHISDSYQTFKNHYQLYG